MHGLILNTSVMCKVSVVKDIPRLISASLSLIALGYKRIKEQSAILLHDLWDLDAENQTQGIIKKFLPNYEAEVKKKKDRPTGKLDGNGTPLLGNRMNIVYPLFRTFGLNLWGIAFIKLIATLLTFVSPTVLNALITFVSSDGKLRFEEV